MSETSDRSHLRRHAVRLVETDAELSGFLGAILARYRAIERIDRAEVARRLEIDPDRLDALALCRAPRPDQFRTDVEAIAARFGANPRALAEALRTVAAVDAFGGTADVAWLEAARDADPPDAPPAPERER